jgi:hypothetical protein
MLKATEKNVSVPNKEELNSLSKILFFSLFFILPYISLSTSSSCFLFFNGPPDKLTGGTVIYGFKSSLQGHGKYFSDFTAQKLDIIS